MSDRDSEIVQLQRVLSFVRARESRHKYKKLTVIVNTRFYIRDSSWELLYMVSVDHLVTDMCSVTVPVNREQVQPGIHGFPFALRHSQPFYSVRRH
jgi:hypothetical protein